MLTSLADIIGAMNMSKNAPTKCEPVQFPVVRTLFNLPRKLWSERNGLKCLDPSRAVQSQKEEADINTIVRNFGLTGVLPVGVRVPQYGDFTGTGDYRDCVEAVRAAQESFDKLPATLRAELDNDPDIGS